MMEAAPTHEHDDDVAPSATSRRAGPRSLLLAVLVAAMSALLLRDHAAHPLGITHSTLPWWALAALFLVAEVCVFHVEFRREVYSFSLSEIPMVLGLLFASPLHLVLGRIVGELTYLSAIQRQGVRKLVVNLACFALECAVLVRVAQPLLRRGAHTVPLTSPAAWLAVLTAVLAASLTGVLMIAVVVTWHGAPVDVRRVLFTGSVTAFTNGSLALVTAILLQVNPASVVLLASVVLVVVTAYRRYSALSQRYESLQLLYDFTRLVSGPERPDAVLHTVLAEARRLLRAERAVIELLDDEGKPLRWRVGGDLDAPLSEDGHEAQESGTGLPGLFADERRAIVVSKRDRDPAHRALATSLGGPDAIVAPLLEGGRLIGAIAVAERQGGVATFEKSDARLFETLANHAGVALANVTLIERLHEEASRRRHDALHDALTGMPNRVLFRQRLEQAVAEGRRTGEKVGVGIVDLDRFKEINDTLGHHAGDLALQEAGRRLQDAVGPAALVARLGGDEFGLLFPNVHTPASVLLVAMGVRAALSRPFELHGLRLTLGASIGLSLAPDHGEDHATLLQRADVAMYAAKSASTTGVELYASDRDENTTRRLTLANGIADAIVEGQLCVYYQPKASLRTDRIHAVEALVRWTHPVYGAVSPVEFIPLAERTGDIAELTMYVLETAMNQLVQWTREGRDLTAAVNLSALSLLDETLPDTLRAMLRARDLPPERLTLEITESSIMSDPARILAIIEDLNELGVRLSIDDFGTGYSSLAYLRRLPVDEVKIDKSFVLPMTHDPSSEAIVRLVIDLAHHLDLSVVAEGVEDRETWERLRSLGCDDIQGYALSRPLPIADFQALLREREDGGGRAVA